MPFSNGNFGSLWFVKKGPDVSVTSGFLPFSPITLLVVANVTAEYPKLWGSILSTIHSIPLQVWMVVEWIVLNQGPYVLYKPHWLPIGFWLQFKMLLIIFKVLHGIGPVYLRGHLLIKVYACPICTLDPLIEIMLLCGIQEMDLYSGNSCFMEQPFSHHIVGLDFAVKTGCFSGIMICWNHD